MRPGTRLPAFAALLLAATLVWPGCGGGGGGDITDPQTGTLDVATVTTGPEPDADGYAVSIDGAAAEPVGINALLRRETVATGAHTVELSGLAPNCTITGAARRSVTVAADAVTTASYAVACVATTGAIAVTVASSGPADADGYRILLDGVDAGALAVTGTVTLPALAPGAHTVGLDGLAATCRVEGESSRAVSVTAGATATVGFEVTCTAISGDLTITTSTTGSPGDPDGYTVTVDAGDARAIGAAASLTLDGLAPGPHSVLLGGIASNCAVGGDNPRTVTVETGSAATVAFTVTCSPTTGALTVTITGLPAGTDASVTVTGPGGFSRQPTATRTFSDLAPGSYSVAAAEVTGSGTRFAPAPASQTVTVSAGSSASATVTYAAVATPTLNLRIDGWHLTQSVQTSGNTLPLIANREAYLRVFVLASEPNGVAPPVRVHLFQGGTEVSTLLVPAPSSSTPTTKDEDRLASSWNVKIPRALIGPGFSLLAEVDPDNTVAERDEGDNRFPRNGIARAPEVRTAPLLGIRFVPVRQQVNTLTGDVTADNKARFLELTRRIYPLPGTDGDLHAVYTTDTEEPLTPDDANGGWVTILSELDALRVAEGTSRQYYGVVKIDYFFGIAGIGFVGLPTAMGYDNEADRGRVMAHELGHTWNRIHSPCGLAGGTDPDYPYAGGMTGVYGVDLPEEQLKPPTLPDIMGYCGDPWISDYTYQAVMDFRGTASARALRVAAAPERCLLVWGRVRDGRMVLEPAFEVVTRPSLPKRPGAYVVDARATDGTTVFRLSFDAATIADDPRGSGHFAFAVPLGPAGTGRLASLRLSGPGGEAAAARMAPPEGAAAAAPDSAMAQRTAAGVRVRWDAARSPMALVRDAETGEILSFARGGDIEVASAKSRVEVVLSDRVGSRRLVLPVAP
jgi:hypothetical protein